MKRFLLTLGALVVIGIIIVSSFVHSYNSLVAQREQATTQEHQIETQMQRRSDLIPNLVAATKGGMTQEKAIFDDIAKAQAAFTNAQSGTPDKLNAGAQVGAALRGYLVVAQQYPDLKSLNSVQELITELEGTENRIGVARQRYNEDVQIYNQHIQSFPANLFSSSWGFQQMAFFQDTTAAQTAPKVDFTK